MRTCRLLSRGAAVRRVASAITGFATALSFAIAAPGTDRDGDGSAHLTGELRQWHKVTLELAGPFARETDTSPNPFTDYRMTAIFRHEASGATLAVPGYFAADGRAADTSADHGTCWRAHLAPPKTGRWTWRIEFVRGPGVAVSDDPGEPIPPYHGQQGEFEVQTSDKSPPDFRARGRLTVTGRRYRRFEGDGTWFLKTGADAPETLLAYADFDGTVAGKPKAAPLKTYAPHQRDWRDGDPSWGNGRGKGIIGALNYLAAAGANGISFLTYNAGGDGDNVWPFVARDDKFHYDCSKLDQWGRVFDHATRRGLHLHVKLQETEMGDHRRGHEAKPARVSESLDGGRLGPERRLYLRELIARFAHALARTWNLGEECTLSTDEVVNMARWIRRLDPYGHLIVVHTFPNWQDRVYRPLLGRADVLTGVSLQNAWNAAHARTWQWIEESRKAGHPWVVAHDEQNPAELGVPPDKGYKGFDGQAADGKQKAYTRHDIRKLALWGTLMAGGEGVEYYFGYRLPENDLLCEDFRSRDQSWREAAVAREFFLANNVPFWDMVNADELVANPHRSNTVFCLARPGDVYAVYLPTGGSTTLDLSGAAGRFSVAWFNPRQGGALCPGQPAAVDGGRAVVLGPPPSDSGEDWAVLLRRR